MREVQRAAKNRPEPQERARFTRIRGQARLVQPEDPNRCVEQPIHNAHARSNIIQLLRQIEISRVEDHAEDPTRVPTVPESQIVLPQRISSWDLILELLNAPVVREEVEEGEEHAGGFLHAEEAEEGPFSVELEDRFEVGRFARKAGVGGDVLASVVAFAWTGPEEEAVVEGFEDRSVTTIVLYSLKRCHTYLQRLRAGITIGEHALLRTISAFIPKIAGDRLTATQLLNSGSRSPRDARAVDANSKRRHDNDSSPSGCRKRLLCMMHACVGVFARESFLDAEGS